MSSDFLETIENLISPSFPDETWRKSFLIIPRKSINEKILWGLCWKRDKLTRLPDDYPDKLMTHRWSYIYASNKEYFLEKLSNENN